MRVVSTRTMINDDAKHKNNANEVAKHKNTNNVAKHKNNANKAAN